MKLTFMPPAVTEKEEEAYILGSKAFARRIMGECISELGWSGEDSNEARGAAFMLERAEVVSKLREMCGTHGDNDWPDNLHLVDVLEKHLYHLYRHLPDPEDD